MLSVYVNYQYDWWDGQTMQKYFVVPHYNTWLEPLVFGFFHAFPYLIAIGLLKLFKYPIKLSVNFWGVFLFGVFLLSIRRGTDFYQVLSVFFNYTEWNFLSRIYYNLYTLLLMFVPLWIAYKVYFKNRIGHFYGLQIRGVSLAPYWIMLGGMIPLVFIASLMDSFLCMYPTYNLIAGTAYAEEVGINKEFSFWMYEFAYIMDYASVEIFFRGFLVFSMVKYLGKHAIIPMVAAYVWLHFGKPLGETIGSAFGGYILGITALYSRNIWGGIFIHMGIAFFMDVFAFWMK